MKVYYWEGSIPKTRELASHALLARVQETACITPPNFIMGSPLVDFNPEGAASDCLTQFGLVRVIDEAAFDITAFVAVLHGVFGVGVRLGVVFYDDQQVIPRAPMPADLFSFFKFDKPDWEGEFEKWTQK